MHTTVIVRWTIDPKKQCLAQVPISTNCLLVNDSQFLPYRHETSWGYGKNQKKFTNGQFWDVWTFFLVTYNKTEKSTFSVQASKQILKKSIKFCNCYVTAGRGLKTLQKFNYINFIVLEYIIIWIKCCVFFYLIPKLQFSVSSQFWTFVKSYTFNQRCSFKD